jgi:hypothetical protein
VNQEAPINMAEQLALAIGLHQRGLLGEAQAIYETLLRRDPAHADALHLLGLTAAPSPSTRAARPSMPIAASCCTS